MKEIQLTQGFTTLVDDEDFERISQFKWHLYKKGNYVCAVRNIRKACDNHFRYLHQFIMDGKLVDHIDRNGLNNQKHNLRFCSHHQNMMNQGPDKTSTSPYKGVCIESRSKRYIAQIKFNYKNKRIGTFKDEIEAAKAYDKKAKELFGEFAYLNFQ